MKIYKDVILKFYKKLFNLRYHWEMSIAERRMFKKYIKKSKNYLEFGSGGSTIFALKNSKAAIKSVDSSKEWFDHMIKEHQEIRDGIKDKRLDFIFVDIGETVAWGTPKDDSGKSNYPNYSASVFKNKKIKYDTVLIDGRFRVACGLQTVLNCDDDTIIMIHDFWNRPWYHILLNYIKPIGKAGTMGVFKKIKHIDKDQLLRDYEKFKFICN